MGVQGRGKGEGARGRGAAARAGLCLGPRWFLVLALALRASRIPRERWRCTRASRGRCRGGCRGRGSEQGQGQGQGEGWASLHPVWRCAGVGGVGGAAGGVTPARRRHRCLGGITLDSIVTSWLKQQHRSCPAPITHRCRPSLPAPAPRVPRAHAGPGCPLQRQRAAWAPASGAAAGACRGGATTGASCTPASASGGL